MKPTTATKYLWTYEKSPWDESSVADTFSVGLFQYLPKAHGKGLKRSKTIRVKGYVSNPEDVYALADTLCKRLNKEKVRVEAPPAWVQKQYSAPKPLDRVEYKPDRFSSAQVRRNRMLVAAATLLPKGFVECPDGTYARHYGQQIHVINFQAHKYGGEYAINLGFTYDFIVPQFQMRKVKISNYHLLDCSSRFRIRPSWFPYRKDVSVLRNQLNENMAACLHTFDEVLEAAADPRAWLNGVLEKHDWGLDVFKASIATYLDDTALFERYAQSALTCDHAAHFKKLFDLTNTKTVWLIQ